MLTIKRLTLENFQSHKFTIIDFDDGLNAIVGPTDSGKTAILRAIKWVLYNEPQGDSFIRQGESQTSVQILFSSGVVVKRYRSKSKNGYEITYADGSTTSFEGFGSQVPQEVLEATKMPKITLRQGETRSLNMAEQLEGPFLLTDNPSLKAAAIGKLVQADVIDYALGQVNLDLRNKKKDCRDLEDELENLNKDLEGYSYLKDLGKTINDLEKIQETLKQREEKLESLNNLRENYTKIQELINNLENIKTSLKDLSSAESLYYETFNKLGLLNNLDHMAQAYFLNRKRLEATESIKNKLKEVDLADHTINGLSNKISHLYQLNNLFLNLQANKKRKTSIKGIYDKLSQVDQAQDLYKQADKLERKYKDYTTARTNLLVLKDRIKNGNAYISNFKNLDKSDDLYNLIKQSLDKAKILEEKKSQYKLIESKILKEKSTIKTTEDKIKDVEEAYKKLIGEMKVCPTCKRPFDLTNTNEIIKHLSE